MSCLCAIPGVFAQSTPIGDVLSFAKAGKSVELSLRGGWLAAIEFIEEDTARVRINPRGKFSTFQTGAIQKADFTRPEPNVVDGGSAILVATRKATVAVLKSPFQVVVLRSDQSTVFSDEPQGVTWHPENDLIATRKLAPQAEAYFGLGARGGPINRRGRRFFMHNVDRDAYGEFDDPLYISIPFYYGLYGGKAYGVFLDKPEDPFFDMDSDKVGTVTFGASGGELDYYVFTGPTPADVARAYGKLTGNTQLPPKWALGYHQSRYGYKSQQEYLDLANKFRQLKIPCDVLWFDIDYMDNLQMFTWNQETFPAPVEMNRALDSLGFRRVFIIEPLMTVEDRLWPLAAYARYFLENPDGTPYVSGLWYGDVSFLDFTNKAVRDWYKELLKQFLTFGVDGIWNDLNEPAQNYMPQVIYNFDGQRRTDLLARNLYALQQTSLSDEAHRELRPRTRPWTISRSGYSGIQRYAANWSGDALTSYDSLRVNLQMTISMGLSGQNFFGHDIGGFLGSADSDLFLRWLQFGQYIPLFRNHATNTSAEREPWVFGERNTQIAREIINERYRMMPYLYTLFERAASDGQPVVAPLLFHFPDDLQTYGEDQSFMLGPNLLVAPVVQQGATSRTVYLPAGVSWVDYYSERVYSGGVRVTVDAPLGRMPRFVRAGSILVSGPVLQYAYDHDVRQEYKVDVYAGAAESTFELYEDDGITMDFKNGIAARTLITATASSGTRAITFERKLRNWASSAWTLEFVVHGVTQAPSAVKVNTISVAQLGDLASPSDAAAGWSYNPRESKLTVRFPALDSVQLSITP